MKIGVYVPKMFREYSMEYIGENEIHFAFFKTGFVADDSFLGKRFAEIQGGNGKDQGWIRHCVRENIWNIFTKRIKICGLSQTEKNKKTRKKTSQTVCLEHEFS